ncbi:SMP-30/gluconolactonase/LRE family protein [Oricola indica]|jgi:sugar lactone lactonase YvrE|uniref:SMP-30/gluconolactonase/LRE family protein n=1 Tax=Oricola indica TaxID=2872591 RepID=UPI001CBB7AC1|nr:SMP-30/gluconolactonase/LRE family protein [Oricola indica]
MFENLDLLHQANATLAEGPVWDDRLACIYWVDIRRCRIARFETASMSQTGLWVTPNRPGCIGLTDDPGVLAVCHGADVSLLNTRSGTLSPLARLPIETPRYRANDGRVDCAGRLWVGTMIDDIHAPDSFSGGRLFAVGGDGTVTATDEDFELPNGMSWSPDQTTFYINDTTAAKTYRYDFDAKAGRISNRAVLYDHSGGEGFPDGLSIDCEGNIWSAQWDGWNVRKISPSGELLQEIPMPVRRPSSAAFFGEGMDQIVITSAAVDFTSDDFIKSPDAGSLFAMAAETQGLPEHRFAS